MASLEPLSKVDPEIARVIEAERLRQNMHLEMIASENIASRAVMEVQGSVLTNKYAEGYPDNRYYGGCQHVDEAEKLAIERARALFAAEYVNVQPHSGSQANMAAYFALLKPGDTVLAMDLCQGGHLTHGARISFSGQLYNFVHYGVRRDSGILDYDQVEQLARSHRPKLIVAGASAYPRTIDFKAFGDIAKAVGAFLMVDMAHIAGLVAVGIHPSPLPVADVVTSTTHKTLRGPRGGLLMAKKEFAARMGSLVFPGIQGGPLMHVVAAKAVAFREAATPAFEKYQHQLVANAGALAETLLQEGFSLVAGGTDNHMILMDLSKTGITGKQAEEALGKAAIAVNKNAIPYDQRGPAVTSGIRLGTPFLTSRGMGTEQMRRIGTMISRVLRRPDDETVISKVRDQVRQMCKQFPLYC